MQSHGPHKEISMRKNTRQNYVKYEGGYYIFRIVDGEALSKFKASELIPIDIERLVEGVEYIIPIKPDVDGKYRIDEASTKKFT